MIRGENAALAREAANQAENASADDDANHTTGNGLAAIAYALLHLADVIQDGQDN